MSARNNELNAIDDDDEMNGIGQEHRPHSPPLWWIEVPDPVQYLAQPRPRRWNLRFKGYCRCNQCRPSAEDPPRLVSLRRYTEHHRQQRVLDQRLALLRPDRNPLGTDSNPPTKGGSAGPATQAPARSTSTLPAEDYEMFVPREPPDSPFGSSRPSAEGNDDAEQEESELAAMGGSTFLPVELETAEFPFESETSESPLQPGTADGGMVANTAEIPNPFDLEDEAMDISTSAHPTHSAALDQGILRRISSPIWHDFIDQYVDCTSLIHPNLLADRPIPKRDAIAHSIIESVIYGTNIALVGQWNLSQSAIQFNMTQQWNIFRYGLLLGRMMSGSLSELSANARTEDLELFMAFDAARPAVRTLRSAERHLSPDLKDLLEVHAACSYQYCQKVFYEFRSTNEFKTGAMCSHCKTVPDGEKNLGLVPFPRMRLAVALERLLNIDGVEKMVDQAEGRRQADEDFDRSKFPDLKIYRQAYSGSDWISKALDGLNAVEPLPDGSLIVRINFGIDWYQQSRGNHARTSSIGPVIAHVTNLPIKLRGSLPLSLLLAITPGPSEIRGENLHQYLLPLCLELRQAQLRGIVIKTPSHPEGRRVYVVVGAICCDGPARVAVTGGPNFNRMGQFCIRCDVVKKHQYKPETCVWNVRTSFDAAGRVYAERKTYNTKLTGAIAAHRQEYRRRDPSVEPPFYPQDYRKELMKVYRPFPGDISALDIIPLFDKELATTYDPMHMLCIGIIKNFFKNIMYTGDKYHRVAPTTSAQAATTPSVDLDLENAPDDALVESESSEEEALADDYRVRQARRPARVPPPASEKHKSTSRSGRKPDAPTGVPKQLKQPKSAKKCAPLLTPLHQDLFHELMKEVILPPEVDGIAAYTFFKGSSGTASAAQWRTFARHYAPLVTVELWTHNDAIRKARPSEYNASLDETELLNLLRVSQITEMALRPVISSKQLQILRHYIKSLQDRVFVQRPGIVKCANMHWLAHLPEDIERYGPVYSWWLFVYERMNKLLKSANSNGHAPDTPLIAFKKFLRLGSLETLSANQPSQGDLLAQYLADRSAQAFRQAVASVNSIEEQRDIFSWQEEQAAAESRAQAGAGADRREPTPITVKKHRLSHLSGREVNGVCATWNKDRLATVKVKENSSDPGAALVLDHTADFYTRFRIGRNHFRTAGPGLSLGKQLAESDFFKYRGCFFERRTDDHVLNCVQRRTVVGLIDSVFEIAAKGKDGSKVIKRFIKVHMLKPYEQRDPYRFAERLPFMNIWLWQADLSDTRIWPLVPERMDALKPVVIKPLYSMPGNRRSPKVWAFKAITHT